MLIHCDKCGTVMEYIDTKSTKAVYHEYYSCPNEKCHRTEKYEIINDPDNGHISVSTIFN